LEWQEDGLPAGKRRLTDNLRAAAAVLRDAEEEEEDEDLPPQPVRVARTNPSSSPMPPAPNFVRPSQGIFDHITQPQERFQVDSRKDFTGLPPLRSDEASAVQLFDRQAYAQDNGQPLDLSSLDPRHFPTTMPPQKVARLLERWGSNAARHEFLTLLAALPPAQRRTLLLDLRKPFEALDREFAPSWIDARLEERQTVRTQPRYIFATLVAEEAIIADIDRFIFPSAATLEQDYRAYLEERRGALQALNGLKSAREALLDMTSRRLTAIEQASSRVFERVLAVAPVDMTMLGTQLTRHQEGIRRHVREMYMAAGRLPTTRPNPPVPDVPNLIDEDDLEVILRQGKDQVIPRYLATMAERAKYIFPAFARDIDEVVVDRTSVFADPDVRAIPQIPNASLPPLGSDQLGSDRIRAGFLALATPRDLRVILDQALEILAGGVTAAQVNPLGERVFTSLDGSIQTLARDLYDKLRLTRGGATVPLSEAERAQLPPAKARYLLVRPFLPGVFTAVPEPLVEQDWTTLVGNEAASAQLVRNTIADLYNMFGLPGKSTWDNLQLLMRVKSTDATHDADTFVLLIIEGLLRLVNKTRPSTDVPVRNITLITPDGHARIAAVITKMTTGAALRLLSKEIGELLLDENPLKHLWDAGLTANAAREAGVWRQLEVFMRDWLPSVSIDIKFAALLPLVRYRLVRTFLEDLYSVIRTDLLALQTKQALDVEETQAEITDLTKDNTDKKATVHSLQWHGLPEHTHRIIYSDEFNASIAMAARFVEETGVADHPRYVCNTNDWIEPKPEWGEGPKRFTLLFAEIVGFKYRDLLSRAPGQYLEKTRADANRTEQRQLIRRLTRFEYYFDPYQQTGYFRPLHM
jgi:hypothetical protein